MVDVRSCLTKSTRKHGYPLRCMYGATSALEGLFPCLRPDASLSRLRVISGVPDPVDVFQACWTHDSRKELFWLWRWFWKGVAGSFLSTSVNCNTGHSGLIDFTLRDFKPLPPSFQGKALIVRGYFLSTTDTFPRRGKKMESKFHYLEGILNGFNDAGSSVWAENPFDTRSVLTEREKNHLPTAIWRIQILQF